MQNSTPLDRFILFIIWYFSHQKHMIHLASRFPVFKQVQRNTRTYSSLSSDTLKMANPMVRFSPAPRALWIFISLCCSETNSSSCSWEISNTNWEHTQRETECVCVCYTEKFWVARKWNCCRDVEAGELWWYLRGLYQGTNSEKTVDVCCRGPESSIRLWQ